MRKKGSLVGLDGTVGIDGELAVLDFAHGAKAAANSFAHVGCLGHGLGERRGKQKI